MINIENLQSAKFMSKEEISKVAPSVFTMNPSNEVSDKYTHIPTEEVINDMEELGWGVVDAKEVKARTKSTKGFQKHLLVFRNNDIVINGEDGDTVFPQILLTNSQGHGMPGSIITRSENSFFLKWVPKLAYAHQPSCASTQLPNCNDVRLSCLHF